MRLFIQRLLRVLLQIALISALYICCLAWYCNTFNGTTWQEILTDVSTIGGLYLILFGLMYWKGHKQSRQDMKFLLGFFTVIAAFALIVIYLGNNTSEKFYSMHEDIYPMRIDEIGYQNHVPIWGIIFLFQAVLPIVSGGLYGRYIRMKGIKKKNW